MTIGRLLTQTAARWPDSEAVVEGSTRLTYRELETRVARFANGLRDRGVAPGDGVGIFAANSLEQIVATLAVQSIDAVAVPVNPRFSPGELAAVLTDAEATALVCDGPRTDVVGRADLPTVERIVSTEPRGDMLPFEAVVDSGDDAYPTADADLDDPALMMHTSGTTGRPKLVVIDHRGQLLNSMACAVELDFAHEDTALHIAPLCHSAGYLNLFLPCLQLGATHVLQSTFDPERAVQRIDSESVTVSLGVPTHFQKLRELGSAAAETDTDSLRMLITSGAPIARDTVAWVRDTLCETFVNVYGLTETTGLVTVARDVRPDGEGFPIGEPFLNVEVRLVEVGDDVPPEATVDPGTRGELVVRSPKVMQGYYGLPDRTAETLREGWLFTGDVAIERDGRYYLLDRVDNRIISGGENIYPQEIERVLEGHPDVVDAAVRGEPHPSLGETVAAYVVSREPDLDLDDLEAFWRDRGDVADFKRPRRLTVVEAIPRNQSGKILREELGSAAE